MSGSLSGAVQIGLDSTRISSCPVLSRWVASWYRRRLFCPSPACLPMHACLSALSSFSPSLAIAHECEKAHALPPRTKNKQQKNSTYGHPLSFVKRKKQIIAVPQRLSPITALNPKQKHQAPGGESYQGRVAVLLYCPMTPLKSKSAPRQRNQSFPSQRDNPLEQSGDDCDPNRKWYLGSCEETRPRKSWVPPDWRSSWPARDCTPTA